LACVYKILLFKVNIFKYLSVLAKHGLLYLASSCLLVRFYKWQSPLPNTGKWVGTCFI
jgi:hypothetical protein